jgi:6-phosphogluconolactonase (cycloisomerase 2 family)
MFSRRTTSNVLLPVILFACYAETTHAKSLYVISDTDNSQMQTYKIDGTGLIHQTDYTFDTWGPVGLAIDESSYGAFLFVTFENTGQIKIIDAKTMQCVGSVNATGASNLAGIVVDKGKRKVYVINRQYGGYLYVYSWDAQDTSLTPDFEYPYYVQLQDCSVGYGLALDEQNGRLYVGDNTYTVKYYNTDDWSKVGEFTIGDTVVGIAIDVENQYVYTGSWQFGSYGVYLTKYELSTGLETYVNVGSPVVGIAVDQQTGLVYLTTYGSSDDEYYPNPPQDRILVYNSDLQQLWYSGDIGNPAGICVPTGDVYYKPDVFGLSKNDGGVVCVSPEQEFTYSIEYSGNGYGDTSVVITDTLPLEVTYINSSSGGQYDEPKHTVTWNFPSIEPEQSGTLQIQVALNCHADPGGTITNVVEMEGVNYYSKRTLGTQVCCYDSGPIIYVDKDATNGCNNGTSWDNAYIDLQKALARARRCPGATAIWVAAGTYKPTTNPADSGATFELVEGVGVFGHFGGVGTYETCINQRNFADANNETILEGKIGGNNYEAVKYVVTANVIQNSILDGFTVADSYGAYGAGVFLDNSDLAIVNCKLRANDAYGVYSTAIESSFPDIHNCIFMDNSASGLYCNRSRPAITNTIFDGNNTTGCAVYADSLSAIEMTDCTAENHAGSAIYAAYTDIDMEDCSIKNNGYGISCFDSDPVISHSIIENNGGEGIWCESGSSIDLANSVIRFNGDDGICLKDALSTTIKNNWIHNNGTGQSGCGIYLESQIAQPLIRNNTICSNFAYGIQSYSGTEPVIANCIVWNNITGNLRREGGSLQYVTYSCIGGGYTGTGNIDSNPIFKNASDPNDLHIAADSPCKNTGDPTGNYDNETDIDDEARVKYGRVDMGADEFYWSPADFDGNEIVNFIDYALFADNWRSNNAAFSLDGDNDVDCYDLAIFCEDWLWQAGWSKPFSSGYSVMESGKTGLQTVNLENTYNFEYVTTDKTVAHSNLMLLDTKAILRAMPQRLAAKAEKFYAVRAVPQETSPIEITPLEIEELLKWLEELWLTDPEMPKTIDKDLWQKFIKSIEEILDDITR